MVHLLAAGGHVLLAAAVDHRHLAAQAQRRAGGVHGHVASAHDDDLAAQIDGGVVVFVVAVHEVGARQQLVGADDADEGLALDAHELGQAGAGGYVDGVVLHLAEELVDGDALADDDVGAYLDAQTAQVLDLGFHHLLLGQAEFGDAVDEHAAGMVQRLKDGDLVAVLGEVAGAGEAAGAAADDRHLAACRVALALRLGLCAVVVGHEALQGADGYGLVLHAHHTAALALGLLRADASADGRQGGVVGDGDIGLVEVLFLDVLYELRYVDTHGAGLDAARLFALQAAAGLDEGLVLGEAEGDLVEVVGAHGGVLLAWLLALLGFGHGGLHGRGQIALVAALRGGYAVAPCVGGLQLACCLVEVHEMAVELRAVHAAELHLVAYAHAAGAAHAGAVDHHAVEADDGGQVVFLGGEADELHHRQRPDGHAVAVFHALGAELVDLGRHQPLLAVGAVVGHDVQVVAHGA